MNFGQALEELKQGKKLQREGWNGKGLFVVFQPSSDIQKNQIRNEILNDHYKNSYTESMVIQPHFMIKNSNETVSTWVPSVNDCLAEDWAVI